MYFDMYTYILLLYTVSFCLLTSYSALAAGGGEEVGRNRDGRSSDKINIYIPLGTVHVIHSSAVARDASVL